MDAALKGLVKKPKDKTSPPSGGGGGGGGSIIDSGESNELDVRVDGKTEREDSLATGKVDDSDEGRITINVNSDKVSDLLKNNKGKEINIATNRNDASVEGITLKNIRDLQENLGSLEIQTPLAVLPLSAGQIDADKILKEFGNPKDADVSVILRIRPSDQNTVNTIKDAAASKGLEILTNPLDIELSFSFNGKTIRPKTLEGYAPIYIALPEGIDPKKITTGIVTYPDGTIFHVPTEVQYMSGRYYAKINDLKNHASYSVIWNPKEFDDVKDHWVKDAANNMGARLVIEGVGNNLFVPDRPVNRAEFATFIVRGLGLMDKDINKSIFMDVSQDIWYHDPVTIANDFGVVLGYSEDTFGGDRMISREEGMVMIARAYRLILPQAALLSSEIQKSLSGYQDEISVADWAKEDVALMISSGIVHGNDDGYLTPTRMMTRAEAAALIERLLVHSQLINYD